MEAQKLFLDEFSVLVSLAVSILDEHLAVTDEKQYHIVTHSSY